MIVRSPDLITLSKLGLLDRCFDLERLVHNAKHLKRYFALCDCILDVNI